MYALVLMCVDVMVLSSLPLFFFLGGSPGNRTCVIPTCCGKLYFGIIMHTVLRIHVDTLFIIDDLDLRRYYWL